MGKFEPHFKVACAYFPERKHYKFNHDFYRGNVSDCYDFLERDETML